MTTLFGFYSMGLQAINVARLGLQVTGDNIANVANPGYARRRLDLASGFPVRVEGGLLDLGVRVGGLRRQADVFIQAGLEREKGNYAGSQRLLTGLRDIESIFGELGDEGILSAYAELSNRFTELATEPDDLARRSAALSAADTLARQIQSTNRRLEEQQRFENENVRALVTEVNALTDALARLNRDIVSAEGGGGTAAPLRDERDRVVERLAELTGGQASPSDKGRVLFNLPGGPTLVTGDTALPITLQADGTGTLALTRNGQDFTGRVRGGELGAALELRDVQLAGRLDDLDAFAADLIDRANALTTGAFDRDGNVGIPLFQPDPAPANAASVIALNTALVGNPALLAVSATGEPGDGSVATLLAELRESASVALGDRTPEGFLGDILSDLGNRVVQADVDTEVSRSLLDNLEARRDAVSGVNLDEEAVDLVRYQQSFEAAARFLTVLNEVTEISLSLAD